MRRVFLSTFPLTAAAAVTALLAACADTRGGPIPYNVANFGSPDTTVSAPLEGGYRIAPMDTLTIRVFGMQDLTGTIRWTSAATSPCR